MHISMFCSFLIGSWVWEHLWRNTIYLFFWKICTSWVKNGRRLLFPHCKNAEKNSPWHFADCLEIPPFFHNNFFSLTLIRTWKEGPFFKQLMVSPNCLESLIFYEMEGRFISRADRIPLVFEITFSYNFCVYVLHVTWVEVEKFLPNHTDRHHGFYS